MPVGHMYDNFSRKQKAWNLARQQVKAKFPNLQIDSTGWHKAVSNRYHRILK